MTLLALSPPGMMEMVVLLIIVLILFGPKALPSLGKAMGTALREFKGAANKFNEELESEVEADAKRTAAPAKPAPAGTASSTQPTDPH